MVLRHGHFKHSSSLRWNILHELFGGLTDSHLIVGVSDQHMLEPVRDWVRRQLQEQLPYRRRSDISKVARSRPIPATTGANTHIQEILL